VNLAFALAAKGKRVGLLDIDIHGPSIPVMLGLEHEHPMPYGEGLLPVEIGDLKVMSIGFLLQQNDNAIIWRGPLKMGAIEQFLRDVEWGELDFLVVDAPPGTGDEPLVGRTMLPTPARSSVTTPQKVSTADVRKSIPSAGAFASCHRRSGEHERAGPAQVRRAHHGISPRRS
jgi:Mrp family chromosome partitioning ATPase